MLREETNKSREKERKEIVKVQEMRMRRMRNKKIIAKYYLVTVVLPSCVNRYNLAIFVTLIHTCLYVYTHVCSRFVDNCFVRRKGLCTHISTLKNKSLMCSNTYTQSLHYINCVILLEIFETYSSHLSILYNTMIITHIIYVCTYMCIYALE